MATVLKALPPTTAGRPSKYDWGKWTDGRAWEIKQGKDFTCSCDTVAMTIYQRARREGCKVTIRRVDAGTLAFQFAKKGR